MSSRATRELSAPLLDGSEEFGTESGDYRDAAAGDWGESSSLYHAPPRAPPRYESGDDDEDEGEAAGRTPDYSPALTAENTPEMPPGRAEPISPVGYSSETMRRRPRLPPAYRHPLPVINFYGPGVEPRGSNASGAGATASQRRVSAKGRRRRFATAARQASAERGTQGGPSRLGDSLRAGEAGESAGDDEGSERRCTVYCCALALELIGICDAEAARGASCRWYKDGLNTVVHAQANRRDIRRDIRRDMERWAQRRSECRNPRAGRQ